MAIYAGTYLDPVTDAPFDRNAFSRSLPCGPKSVQIRTRGRRRSAPKTKWRVAVDKLAFAWTCRMSPEQQDQWKVLAARWCTHRIPGEPATLTTPFGAFAQVNFMRCYYGNYPMSLWPELPGPVITNWGVAGAFFSTQMIHCYYNLGDNPLEYDQKEFEWYQIDPKKQKERWPCYFTRLLMYTVTRGMSPGYHWFKIAARFPLVKNRNAMFLLRQRDAYQYQQTYYSYYYVI